MTARGSERGGDLRRAIYAGPHALVGSPVTRAIVWINVAVFVLEVIASHGASSLGDVSESVLLEFGSNLASLTLHAGQWDRLVASCFLHGSLMHIVFNMYALRQVGPLVEVPVGSARYSAMYLASGVLGSLASAGWHDLRGALAGSVGASGAICGVMGAAIVVAFRVEGWRSSIGWQIGFWLFVTIAMGAAPKSNIDNAAHLGGFVGGTAIALTWRRGVRDTTTKRVVYIGSVTLLCVAALVTTLVRATTDPYAFLDAQRRTERVVDAISRGDCAGARRELKALESRPPSTAELEGIRTAVDEVCAQRNSDH